jgi:signal peptidase II
LTAEARSGRRPAIGGWTRLAAVSGVVLVLDQVTKAVVRGAVQRGEEVEVALGLQIVNVRNRGIAFGLLEDTGPLLVAVTLITMAVLVGWFATDPARPGMWLGIGLIVGGAGGNLIDRLREGEVTDFVDLPVWPAFNVADMAITVGVILLVLLALAGERSRSERGPAGR